MKRIVVILVLLMFCCGVQAAEKEADAKITVIGKRLPALGTDPAKAPYKVSVGYAQDIEQDSPRTFPEILSRTEGLYRNDNTGSAVDQVLGIRGFTLGEEISVFVDGIRYNEADANNIYWYYVPLENIGRFELLKGADSSVYGHGGFGGTVHLYRKKHFDPYVKIEAGGLGYGSQTVGFAWSNDDMFGNMVLDHKAATGFRKFDNYDLSNIDIQQGVYLDRDKSESLEIGWQKATGYTNYAGELTEDELERNRYQAIAGDRNKANADMLTFRYKYNIHPELSMKTNYAVSWKQANYTAITRPGFGGTIGRTRLITNQAGRSIITQFDWRKDLLLSNEVWNFGFEDQISFIDNRSYGIDQNWVKTNKTADSLTTKSEKAYFLGYEGALAKYWIFDLGVRQDTVNFDYHNYLMARGLDKSAFMARTHHAGLFWEIAKEGGIFTSYRQAFKAPSLYELFDVTGWGVNNNKLGPERAKTSEIGLRWGFMDNLQTELSLYRTEVEDEIILASLPAAPWARNMNQQSTLRNGVELSFDQELSKALEWKLGYATCQARYVDTEGHALDGKTIPMVPEDNLNASILWSFIPEYSLYLQYQKVGMQYISWDDANDHEKMSPYQVVDLELAKEQEWGRVYLDVKNLFNELYNTRGINSYDLSVFEWKQYYNPAPPRTVVIGTKIMF